jgi:hypothetical protein
MSKTFITVAVREHPDSRPAARMAGRHHQRDGRRGHHQRGGSRGFELLKFIGGRLSHTKSEKAMQQVNS